MTHSNRPIAELSSTTTPTEAVDNYSLVSQDDLSRPAVYVAGDLYTFLATTRETDFNFNFFDFFLPVTGGPPPHIHFYEDEVWHTINGDIQYNFGNQGTDSIVVPEGTTLFGPLEKTHGFKNLDSIASVSGVTPGTRTLSITAPGALDLLFEAAATRVIDRNEPVLGFGESTGEGFIDPFKVAKFGARTDGSVIFDETRIANYEAPEDALDYIIVLPDDAEGEVVERAKEIAELDGFKVWTTGEHAGLSKRPTFTGSFGLEYTSLISFEESGNKLSYNEFSLEPQKLAFSDTSIQSNLLGSQVVEPTESLATGVSTLELNSEGDIEYSLTVTGLDFGELVEGETPLTPNDDNDDITAIHIHSGQRGTNGEHVFNILDPNEQNEEDLSIVLNEDETATISGTWNQTEKEIPTSLFDFFNDSFNGSLPGTESNFYFQIHTEGNPDGEIRGQIASTTDANNFPEAIESDDHELLYVKEGQLSAKIGNEIRLIGKDDFVYVAPGREYSIANFSNETVESLAVTVVDREPPETVNNESFPVPSNSIYGDEEDNELFAINDGDGLYGREGNDILDASLDKDRQKNGYNLLDGNQGDDILIAGSNDKLVGGEGDDLLNIRQGDNNLLYGGSGADRFQIVNGLLPDAIEVEYSEDSEKFLLEGLSFPELVDTRNTIADFELGVDKIRISGVENIVSTFEDLELLPAFGDLDSTSIIATFTEDGIDKEISLANVSGVIFNELSPDDFIFA